MPTNNTIDDIVVTSATQTEDQVRARADAQAAATAATDTSSAGTPPAGEKPVDATTAPPATGTTTDDDATEQEAASDRPDAEVSEAARRLRGNRSDVRKTQMQRDIDALTRRKRDLERDVASIESRRSATPPAPPVAGPKTDARATAAAPNAAPTFSFPSYEEWQDKPENQDKGHAEYTDERTDARYEFNQHRAAVENDRRAGEAAEAREVTEFHGHEDALRQEIPDYDDVLARTTLPDMPEPAQHALAKLVRMQGATGPRILYHLATHPADASRIAATRNPAELIFEVGRVSALLTGKPAPKENPAPGAVHAAPPPAKPTTNAPAPVSEIRGGASVGRSLTSLAADSEDADAYISARQPHLLERSRRA